MKIFVRIKSFEFLVLSSNFPLEAIMATAIPCISLKIFAKIIGVVFVASLFFISDINKKLATYEGISQANKKCDFAPEFNSTLGIYTVRNLPLIWVFWEGSKIPPYIQLSLETFRCHTYSVANLMVVDSTFIKSIIREVPEGFDWLQPHHKSDYFRCVIPLHYGGIYLDADTIQLRSIENLIDQLVESDLVGYSWYESMFGWAIFAAKAGNLLMSKWKFEADRILVRKLESLRNYSDSQQNYPIDWGELIGPIVEPTVRELVDSGDLKYSSIPGPSTYGQLVENSTLINELFNGISPDLQRMADNLNYSVDYLLYHNSNVDNELKNMTIEEFLQLDTLFTYLIRKSLYQCKALQNGYYTSDVLTKLLRFSK